MYSVELLDADLRHFVNDAHGLTPSIFYVISVVDAVDGSRQWMPRRAYHRDATRSLYLPEAGAGEDFVHAPQAKQAYTGPIGHVSESDRWNVSAPDRSSRLDVTPDCLNWQEGDLIAASGAAVGPTFRIRITDPEFPILYTSRPYGLTGTVKDTAVHGAAKLVTIHLPEGRDLLDSPLLRHLQISWVEFVNQHADASFESGMLVWGQDGLAGFAAARGDQSVIATSDFTVDIDNDGDRPEFPRRITHRGGEETLVWNSLPRGGRWPTRDDIPDGYRFSRGVVHRHGTPPPVNSYAFAETFQDRM